MPPKNHILLAMRMMAWERAKGELRSMLQTFFSEGDETVSQDFVKQRKLIEDFIKQYSDWHA